jgi:hypothetical protein
MLERHEFPVLFVAGPQAPPRGEPDAQPDR